LIENNKFGEPRQGKNNDNSHPPIHPTKAGDGLTGREALLYDFVFFILFSV
jgi:DNA topoisomerase-3